MTLELTRVEAPTVQEALQKIRAMLGSDAMIVSTRKIRRGGVLGVGSQEIVEVYAADTRSRIENIRREKSNRSRQVDGASAAGASAPDLAAREATVSRKGDVSPQEPPADVEDHALEGPGLRHEIRGPSSRGADRRRHDLPFLRECYETLVSHDVEPKIADHLVERIGSLRVPPGYPDSARVRAMVRAQLAKLFLPNVPSEERGKPRILFLVGPTGVGKTTTIAKLAARAKINERRRVGLITIDTFRIAAVDQLEKYAQIIGLPLFVAASPSELRLAIGEFRSQGVEVVFVDSAGRSPRDELKMAELREFVATVPESEVHLVVSATTHGKTVLSVAKRFAGIGFHKLLLTKADETISLGSMVNALVSIGRPVSFVTDGQNVPDDIVPSDPERLADLVLRTNAL
jgi:flagellar biosynthesis protein FlhF